jgi:hypothetical protein
MKTNLSTLLLAVTASTAILQGQIIPGQYIAVFKDHVRDHPAAAQALAAQHGLTVAYVYQSALKGFAFGGSPQAAAALARRPDIAYLEPDQVRQAWGQTIPTGINRADVEKAVDINGTDDAIEVDVAIIDTGLDSDHPDLRIDPNGVRFYVSRNRIVSDNNWEDDNGHGTHVGGTVAAIDNGLGVVGVAPGARLTAVKVLDKNGSGSLSGVIAGVDWVAANAIRFEVANMSLGGGRSQAENDAVRKAVEKGVVFVVAAGNDDADANNYSPASEPTAITVSALTDSDGSPGGGGGATSYGADDTFATFSNYGSVVDICAPGVDILSTYPGGGYAIGSGTSMAAPHVAGAAALYIARNGLDKSATGVAAVANALKAAGWKPGDDEYLLGGDKDTYPEPLLNLAALFGPVNASPVVTIISPKEVTQFGSGTTITFTGSATDAEQGDLTGALVWTSNLADKIIGTGGSVSATLVDGIHTITATCKDSAGATGSATITVTVGTVVVPNTIVVPNDFKNTEAAGWSGTITGPIRIQQVYSKNHFGGGTVTITGMAFRLDQNTASSSAFGADGLFQQNAGATNQPPVPPLVRGEGDPEAADVSGTVEILVRLSTTAAQPDNLSPLFSANVGADMKLVWTRNPVSINAKTGTSPNEFGDAIVFEVPFTYNPGQGNLLVDITTYSGVTGAYVDASNASNDGASRAWSSNTGATRASNRDTGADVIQFVLK